MATLKALVDETTKIKNDIKTCHTNLKNNLINKDIKVLPTDKMADLINKVNDISSIKVKHGNSLPSTVENGVLFIQTTVEPNRIIIQDVEASLGDKDIYVRSTSNSSLGGTVLYQVGNDNKYVNVYVSFVQQMISGIPTTKNAWVGQGGQWVQFSWEEYVIFSADICNLGSDIPSNWGYYKVLSGSGSPTISILTDPKRLKFYVSSGEYSDAKFYCYLKQTIDLTPFKKIYFDISKISMSSYVYSGVGILHSTEDKVITSKTYSWSQHPSNELVEIDVSTLNGPHRIFATVSTGSANVFCSLEIPKIYLTS